MVSRSKRLCGVVNAAPILLDHPDGGEAAPQIQLVQALVLPLLVPDVLADQYFISANP
jgi:hypothetical protein